MIRMYPRFFLLVILGSFLFVQNTQGFTPTLSPKAEISVLYCGASEELYSKFGHTAFRVRDSINKVDVVYNYGTFNFNTPNFYWKFIIGKLNYKLSKSQFSRFFERYKKDNRFVLEQPLNLSQEEKLKLYNYLENNNKPENQYYLYDYFKNNCSTKIRDALKDTVKGLSFDSTYIKENQTFRELLSKYIAEDPWIKFGINSVLGMPADEKATAWEHMFIPEQLMFGLDNTKKENGEKLGLKAKWVFFPVPRPTNSNLSPSELFGTLLLATIVLCFIDGFRRKASLWFDVIIFAATGILGLLFAFLWFVSDHESMAKNLNLIWAFPLHIIFAITLLQKKYIKFSKVYLLFAGLSAIIFLLIIGFLPQKFDFAVYPLVSILAIRSWFLFFTLDTKTYIGKTKTELAV